MNCGTSSLETWVRRLMAEFRTDLIAIGLSLTPLAILPMSHKETATRVVFLPLDARCTQNGASHESLLSDRSTLDTQQRSTQVAKMTRTGRDCKEVIAVRLADNHGRVADKHWSGSSEERR